MLIAKNIQWDIDIEEEAYEEMKKEIGLPDEIEIPEGMTDIDDIEDYISDVIGYCHSGFELIKIPEKCSMNKLEKLLKRAFENESGKNSYKSGKYAVAFEDRTFETLFWIYENNIPVMEGNIFAKEIQFNVSEDQINFEYYISAIQNVLNGLLDYDFQFTGEIYDDYSKNQLENFSGISKHEFPEDTEEKKPFAIVGYDKDYDVYVEYKRFRNLVVAEAFATYLKKSLEKGTLKRKCSDGILKPIDWVQVVDSENFDKVFWASYEFSERDVKDIMKELSDEVLIEYKSIIFDHWTIDEETDGIYGEICEHCAKKYKNLLSKELNDGGIGPCSVKGCGVVGIDADKNNHYYVTFKPELIRIHERKEWIVNE